MKKFASLGLVLVTCAGVLLRPHSIARAQSAGLVSSILNRMDRNRQNLKTLHANVTMEKYNAQLRDKDTYRGVLKYIPGTVRATSFMWLEWTSPQHEILAVANGRYWLYRPRLGTVIEGSVQSVHDKKDNDLLKLLNMSSAQLRSAFGPLEDLQEETLWGGVHTMHFKAIPKGPASYRYIELWVDDSGMPVQTKMVEKSDDATTVRLTDLQKNAPLSVEEFTPKFDPNIKRIKG